MNIKILKELRKRVRFRVWPWNQQKTKFSILWYIDSRDCMYLMDIAFWYEKRSNEHYEIWGMIYCKVTVANDWIVVSRTDCGTESHTEAEKWQSSDAFKRACVMHGIGRELYSLPRITITAEEKNNNKYDITWYIRDKYKNQLKDWYEEQVELLEKWEFATNNEPEQVKETIDDALEWFGK